MIYKETADSILEELRVLDKKLENEEIGIKDYLFWKSLYVRNLVSCYTIIIDDLENKQS